MLNMELQNYIDWNVQSVFKRIDRNKYAYRVVLFYGDGTKQVRLCSGFATKKEAEEARKLTIGRLVNGTYIVNDRVKVKDFLEYWLEYDIRKRVQSNNTYVTYSNIVKKHIIPFLGSKKLTEINRGDIYRLYKDRAGYSKYIVRLVKTVMNVSFQYALRSKLISINPAKGIDLPKSVELKPYHTRNIDMAKTLNMEQILKLLEASKDTPIHMQILFNVLMGLRRQEINAVKYSDVDYMNRTLSVERQLGKKLNREPAGVEEKPTTKSELPLKTSSSRRELPIPDYMNRTLSVERQLGKKLNREPAGVEEKPTTKSELPLKTSSSRRELPIPDYVFEAIMEERKKYEKNRKRRRSQFLDLDYICCSNYGKPRSKDFHWAHYKKLLRDTGLPDIRWHDLRSTYCTLLLKQDFNPKAVSNLMGHAKEIITMDVYGDNANIIPEEIPELLSYMEEVMPKDSNDDGKENILLDTLVERCCVN